LTAGKQLYSKGYVTIPKASSKERIISNTKVFDFELGQADVDALDALDEGSSFSKHFNALPRSYHKIHFLGLITDWDPTDCP